MIIVLGGSGCVGNAICSAIKKREMQFISITRATYDYTNPEILSSLIEEARPDFLINCAGFTGKPNVDSCELSKTECLAANAVLPGLIRGVCELLDVPWGHVSSGCIYSGYPVSTNGYKEIDPPNFTFRTGKCSWYSGTKSLGEECLADAKKNYIWRLRMPFWNEDSPKNYLSKIMTYEKLLDTTNSLTRLDEFADACLLCFLLQVPYGIYNVTNTGSINTRAITTIIKKTMDPNKEFDFFRNEEEFNKIICTPRSSCSLDNSKLIGAGIKMAHVEDALEDCLRSWVSNSHAPVAPMPRNTFLIR